MKGQGRSPEFLLLDWNPSFFSNWEDFEVTSNDKVLAVHLRTALTCQQKRGFHLPVIFMAWIFPSTDKSKGECHPHCDKLYRLAALLLSWEKKEVLQGTLRYPWHPRPNKLSVEKGKRTRTHTLTYINCFSGHTHRCHTGELAVISCWAKAGWEPQWGPGPLSGSLNLHEFYSSVYSWNRLTTLP